MKKRLFVIFTLLLSLFMLSNCDLGGLIPPFRTPDPITVLDSYEPQEDVDWLIMMYVDGDNDLHDSLYLDINEVERALYNYENIPGEKPKVKVVALWDGWKISGSNIGSVSTQILELGPDPNLTEQGLYQLCENTKDLTVTALTPLEPYTSSNNWINYSFIKESAEVNRGNPKTLENFLKWAEIYYPNAKHKILQFSNHGGGPRSALGGSERRAICWDYTSDSEYAFLKTKDVSDALSKAGYGTNNQLDMLIFDLCLGASIEDSYQFRNYAKYMLASANNIPGYGLDYTKILENIPSLSKDNPLIDFGIGIIDDYKEFYIDNDSENRTDLWEKEINQWKKDLIKQGINTPTEVKINPVDMAKFYGFVTDSNYFPCTLSLIDLSKIKTVAEKIDELAKYIINESSLSEFGYQDGNKFITIKEDLKNFIDCKISLSLAEIKYNGTFNYLYDVGFFAMSLNQYFDILKNNEELFSTVTEMKNRTTALAAALGVAIVYTWREAPPSSLNNGNTCEIPETLTSPVENKDFSLYYGKNLPFGITIAGASIGVRQNKLVDLPLEDFYSSDLDFADTSWDELLKSYFNNQ